MTAVVEEMIFRMKKYKDHDWDFDKKIHKVVKSNKVAKHRKQLYNYLDEDDLDNDEIFLNEVDLEENTK